MNRNVVNLVEETARKLGIAPVELFVFTRRFVQLANSHLEEIIGFHSTPANRACAALSKFVDETLPETRCPNVSRWDLGTGECLDCGKQHHPAGAALVSD